MRGSAPVEGHRGRSDEFTSWPGNNRCALVFVAALAVLVTLTGCGSTSPDVVGFDLAVPPTGEPSTTVITAGQGWQVTIWTAPSPPRKGRVEALYHFEDAGGTALDGLVVSVTPWMPAHGHGAAPVRAEMSPAGGEWYLVKPLALFMAGRWELRTTIEGYGDDGVAPAIDLP